MLRKSFPKKTHRHPSQGDSEARVGMFIQADGEVKTMMDVLPNRFESARRGRNAPHSRIRADRNVCPTKPCPSTFTLPRKIVDTPKPRPAQGIRNANGVQMAI